MILVQIEQKDEVDAEAVEMYLENLCDTNELCFL